jgi:o-succinylbenzoate synthase
MRNSAEWLARLDDITGARWSWHRHQLEFCVPSGTSRGVLHEKPAWFVFIHDANGGLRGVGECSPIPGLSVDPVDNIASMLDRVCANPEMLRFEARGETDELAAYPCVEFGLETAVLDAGNARSAGILFDNAFSRGESGIRINGLVWMGSPDYMQQQIDAKLDDGFTCIKLKIGALDFDAELDLLKRLRARYDQRDLEIRVDANGAFPTSEAMSRLNALSAFALHSIEQPIAPGQISDMREICRRSPIPVALDEELIGVVGPEERERLLEEIRPQYLILKPSLLGGIDSSVHWLRLADQFGIHWWFTSALESNVGLNAIAQLVSETKAATPQGLGTGKIYRNNVPSPLVLASDKLFYRPESAWDYQGLYG